MYIETRKWGRQEGVIVKLKDLFGVLLTIEDVSLYNACGILEWEGEFKHVPQRYFNFKNNYTRG